MQTSSTTNMPKIYYCIAAHNEENNILRCINSLQQQTFKEKVETIICLNGCTDNTEHKILRNKQKYHNLNIKIIHSKKGKINAQNKIIQTITYKQVPCCFIDADVELHKDSVRILYEELSRNKQLIVVGGWPLPKKPKNLSLLQNMLYNILHVRAFYPKAEISTYDVNQYKQYVEKYPQPHISSDFEKRSKIFFHGRIFMMKNKSYYEVPSGNNYADDTYLPNMIHTKYGPGTIRIRYDAIVKYDPYISIKNHFHTYRRVYLDLYYIDKTCPKFVHSRHYEKTKLDWGYIRSQGIIVTTQFSIYKLIIIIEKTCYFFLPKLKISDIWHQ